MGQLSGETVPPLWVSQQSQVTLLAIWTGERLYGRLSVVHRTKILYRGSPTPDERIYGKTGFHPGGI